MTTEAMHMLLCGAVIINSFILFAFMCKVWGIKRNLSTLMLEVMDLRLELRRCQDSISKHKAALATIIPETNTCIGGVTQIRGYSFGTGIGVCSPNPDKFSNLTCARAIMRVLNGATNPMLPKEIAATLIENGITSNSINFKGRVYNALYLLRKKRKVAKHGKAWAKVKKPMLPVLNKMVNQELKTSNDIVS